MAAARIFYRGLIVAFIVLLSMDFTFCDDDIPEIEHEINLCEGKINNCYCTKYTIDCNGPSINDIAEIYPYITEHVKIITITGTSFKVLPDYTFGEGITLNHLQELNLSRNGIETIEKFAFSTMRNLQVLDLSENSIDFTEWETKSDNPLIVLQAIRKLFLHDAFVSLDTELGPHIDHLLPSQMDLIEHLDLSCNDIDYDWNLKSYVKTVLCSEHFTLKHLNLSGNYLSKIPLSECMTNLETYDLSNNRIHTINPVETDMIENLVNLKQMRLGGNPFDCTCVGGPSMLVVYKWLNTTPQPLDVEDMRCSRCEETFEGCLNQPILNVNASQCDGIEPRIVICWGPGGRTVKMARSTFYAILAVSGFVLIVIIAAVVYGVRRRNRRRRMQQHTSNVHVHVEQETKSPRYTRMV